jgi:signal transduction histidine kinase
MTPRREGGVWLFASESRLDVLRDGKWTVETRHYPSFMDPFRLLDDSTGQLWIGTTRQGLVCTSSNNPAVRYFTGTGFPMDQVNALFQDRDGNVWAGGSSGGLARLSRRSFLTLGPEAGFPATAPLCLMEDSRGTIWAAYAQAGLHRVSDEKPGVSIDLGGSAERTGWSLLATHDGRLWFAAYAAGLFAIDGGNSRVWTQAEGLPSNDIHVLAEDAGGGLWIGGVWGLAHFDGNKFVNVTERDGLPQREVAAIVVGGDGNVWAGTLGSGVVRWRDGKYEILAKAQGLPSNNVRSLLADGAGSLWIGTDQGLGLLRDGQIFSFDERNGLANGTISGIVQDGLGNLWLATSRGIVRVSQSDLSAVANGKLERLNVRTFGREDGLPATRMSAGQPDALCARDGRLWFATFNGLAVVDPRNVSAETKPKPTIEAVFVDGVEQPRAAGAALKVPPGTHRIEFRYTAADLTAPGGVQFKRCVEGLGEDWQEVGPERTVAFHSLRPGDYVLRLRAANGSGRWSAEEASVAFVVAPWVWETRWFRASAVIVALFVLGASFRWRMHSLERRRVAQEQFSRQLMEQQEAERKRIAAELHDSLGQNLIVIKNAAWLGTEESEISSARTQFREISELTVKAIDEARAISHAMRPPELDSVGLEAAIRQMVHRVTETSSIDLIFETEPIDGWLPREHEIHFYRALQEGIGNILKHAKASSARLSIIRRDGEISVSLRDNGEGFDPTAASMRHGMGLTSITERVQLMHGTFQMESQPGSGATLTLVVPCKVARG